MGGKLGTPLWRFERSYIPEPNSGCWLWEKALDEKGYGQFYYPPRNMVRASVASWELFRGSRNGLHVLHTCDNRCCVNPDHLELGTHQENIKQRDVRNRRRAPKGTLNGRATLTDEQVLSIRADTRWPRFIAHDFNISISTVKNIKYNVTWRHLL